MTEDKALKKKGGVINQRHRIKKKYDINEDGKIYYKKNIPIELLIEYFEKELTYEDIGRILGCTSQNIARRLQKEGYFVKRNNAFKKHEIKVLENIKRRFAEELQTKNLDKSSALQIATAYAVIFDKIRLLEGKSTENIDEVHRIEQLNDTKKTLLELLKGVEDAKKLKPKEETDGD
jgi:hypothetical protein|tara:strand:- start:260 stop:790 length:531 start_codon:yes stop_codon:yes gene_type:complete